MFNNTVTSGDAIMTKLDFELIKAYNTIADAIAHDRALHNDPVWRGKYDAIQETHLAAMKMIADKIQQVKDL
jgi:hypothetical protein